MIRFMSITKGFSTDTRFQHSVRSCMLRYVTGSCNNINSSYASKIALNARIHLEKNEVVRRHRKSTAMHLYMTALSKLNMLIYSGGIGGVKCRKTCTMLLVSWGDQSFSQTGSINRLRAEQIHRRCWCICNLLRTVRLLLTPFIKH